MLPKMAVEIASARLSSGNDLSGRNLRFEGFDLRSSPHDFCD
jgi:hypothetical protein